MKKAKTVAQLINKRAEVKATLNDVIELYAEESRRNLFVYNGDINDYRAGRPTNDFYRYVWDEETFASEYGMVFTLDDNGEFEPDPQSFNYLAELEDRIHELRECIAKFNTKLTAQIGRC